ncbi:hypothetical protein [Methylorubrum suomiense]|uniref:Uncharacterized protein n=1 Tax=Methylorubrum suomiense TaxID=144191 RepID=A0ABQ4V2T4_9HYPH|nr:hypothetical protein [Methylorubrum suomiense]GJE77212.1 hypothetical protein BGCPKDLD_3815 [Methylorubrum suomiense]
MTTVPHIPLRRPSEPQPINLTALLVSLVALGMGITVPVWLIYALFYLGAFYHGVR